MNALVCCSKRDVFLIVIWRKVFPGMWHEETLASIQAVLGGEDMPVVGYDSDDDPEVLVNKRIKVGHSYVVKGA